MSKKFKVGIQAMTSFEDKISLMIPAYLRGELSDSEHQEIEALAAKNPSIARNIEFQKSLKTALLSNEDRFEPGDLGWAKLSKAIGQEESNSQRTSNSNPKLWQYAAAILAFAAIGQAGILGSMSFKKSDTDVVQYKTVSETTANTFTVKISFNAETTEKQLTESLFSLDATIVAGPSSLGLYDVQFRSEADCNAAFDTLKTKTKIVDTMSSCG